MLTFARRLGFALRRLPEVLGGAEVALTSAAKSDDRKVGRGHRRDARLATAWVGAEAKDSALFMLQCRAMTDEFMPRLDILPKPQRRLWDELADIPPEFVLYGGTAVALHLGHRQSLDFDFFGNRPFDAAELTAAIPLMAAATITQREPNTLSGIVDRGGPVRLSFFGVPGIARLAPPHVAPDNSLQVASLLDLAGTKASVVQQRAEAKDYTDIAAILRDGRVDLPTALASAKAIYGMQFNPQITLKALSFFDDGDLHRLPKSVKDQLARAAREIDLDRLPMIAHPTQPQNRAGRPTR